MEEFSDKELVRFYRESENNIYLEELLSRHKTYVLKVSNNIYKDYRDRVSFEDIKQEVLLIFIKIVKSKYNLDSEAKFFTYLYKTLKLSSLIFVRDDKYFPCPRSKRLIKRTNIVTNLSQIKTYSRKVSDEDRLNYYYSKRKIYSNIGIPTEDSYVVESIKKILTLQEFNLIYDYSVNEMTQRELAIKYKTTQPKISERLKKIIIKVKKNVSF